VLRWTEQQKQIKLGPNLAIGVDCKSRSHSCTCSDGEVCSTCSSTGELNEHQQQLLVDSNGQFLTRYKIATDNDSPLDEKAEWAQVLIEGVST